MKSEQLFQLLVSYNKCHDICEGLSEEAICCFEKSNSITLPSELKSLYRVFDGGEIFIPGTLIYGIKQSSKRKTLLEVNSKVSRGNYTIPIDNVIKTNFSLYNKSIFNQPYLMKKEFESGRFDPNRPWDELLCPESYLYFSGMTFYLNNDRKKAIDCLERYLSLVESKAFAETLIDKPSYQISAKKTIKNINKTI